VVGGAEDKAPNFELRGMTNAKGADADSDDAVSGLRSLWILDADGFNVDSDGAVPDSGSTGLWKAGEVGVVLDLRSFRT
jgi:hypothetical protein